jgi:hypothetical protein
MHLPNELVAEVVAYLPNRDVKSLRLSCKILGQVAGPRLFRRVFLSANLLNIKVFRAIADHDGFRRGVVDIIWDDTRLVSEMPVDEDQEYFAESLMAKFEIPIKDVTNVPQWFVGMCLWNFDHLRIRPGSFDLPLKVSWAYYRRLLRQQKDVLDSGADVEALRYGLEHFPALRKITITAAAHGRLDLPLYETPMIRAFPVGFNYCILPAWPLRFGPIEGDAYNVGSWDRDKMIWRGFCLVMQELAKASGHNVSDLTIDSHFFDTGLNCRVFDGPCEEYDNLVALLQRPGFSRLDLALFADGQNHVGQAWSSLRSGYLKHALGEASDLRDLNLRFTVDYGPIWWGMDHHLDKQLIPLRNILPIDKWKKLRHFGLSGLLVEVADLLSILATLPTTLRSVELSFLEFVENSQFANQSSGYCSLLMGICNTLGWCYRAVGERPFITMHLPGSVDGRRSYNCFDEAVNNFLYRQGSNPFDKVDQYGCYEGAVERYPLSCPDSYGMPIEILE